MSRTILTYADYAALPADGLRYELHEVSCPCAGHPPPPFPDLSLDPADIWV
jgi:hypothetical protein